MTNADYIRQTISDRDLAQCLCLDYSFFKSRYLRDCERVFAYWACKDGNEHGNVHKKGCQAPSVFDWERTYNEETKKWEVTGRKHELSIEIWLSMPYKKDYWDKAIEWSNKEKWY